MNLLEPAHEASEHVDLVSEDVSGKFSYEAPVRRPYPRPIACIRPHVFKIYLLTVTCATCGYLLDAWFQSPHDTAMSSMFPSVPKTFVSRCKSASVPLVCLLFTWFHVWLALWMMFFPIKFWGIPPYLGWQGIVPRKTAPMARRACDAMIGNMITVEEFMDRIQPESFMTSLGDMVGKVCSEVLQRVAQKRLPKLWGALPVSVRVEILTMVKEDAKKHLGPAMMEMKTQIGQFLDIKDMAITAMVGEPTLMVEIFRKAAAREITFIQHFAAVMGVILGFVQLGLYSAVNNKHADYYILPVSGLIIGYLTNWLALKLTFKPTWPHILCCGYVNIQGVFLKRQREAADELSSLICSKVIDFRAMLAYTLRTTDSAFDEVLEIYEKHIHTAVDKGIGVCRHVLPLFTGKDALTGIKADVVSASLDVIPMYSKEIEEYFDTTMDIRSTLSWRLSRLTPPEFEDLIHPIFQEDEWILLLVGAVLGVIIGTFQAFVLEQIQ